MAGLAGLVSTVKFGMDFALLRRERPFIVGLAVTDRCNLRCRHCRVWRSHGRHMPLADIEAVLRRFHARGARLLYLEGGEPCLWRDQDKRLADVVQLAHRLGYLRVHLYTNGTLPIDTAADFSWISADGLHATNRELRGSDLEQVLGNAAACTGHKAMLFTVNAVNHGELRPFLELVRDRLPGVPVFFNLHTPYYGRDELLLEDDARHAVVDTLQALRRKGLPLLNSRPGLERLRPGRGGIPSRLYWVVDQAGEYPCCRVLGDRSVCDHCGYAACEEIHLARSLHPAAVAGLLRSY